MKSSIPFYLLAILMAASCREGTTGNGSTTAIDTTTHDTAFRLVDAKEQIEYARAVQAVIWGIPLVNYRQMYDAMVRQGGKFNELAYWSRPSDWKNQLLTPNTDALYIIPFFNTKDVGPIVLELPPADEGKLVGTIMNCWQEALEDVGPAGADKGKGGKYLILPPGYKNTPPAGFIPLSSNNYSGYALLRAFPKEGQAMDTAKLVQYLKRIKLYPLSSPAGSDTRFIDVTNTVFDATIRYDRSFFVSLDSMIQLEPWIDRDRAMIDILRTIGIEKGHAFTPNDQLGRTLNAGVSAGRNWLEQRYESYPLFYPGSHWFVPATPEMFQAWGSGWRDPDNYPVDGRGVTYFWGFSSVKHTGTDMFQLYLFATRDKAGHPFDGGADYHLSVPANVPASQYWSITLYDYNTHALIRDVPYASRSSLNPDLKRNANGTVDIYLGPQAPAGNASNWVPSKPGIRFEVIFRFYGAEKQLKEKSWVLNEIEKTH